jgi:ADP-ribose pyrophosphatase YjhB (NUDIX family)
MPSEPKWVEWAKRLQTMAQTGLAYARDPYDIERYHAITDIALEMMAAGSETDLAVVRDLFAHAAGHATPMVDVRVAAFRGDKILMVRERRDGRWSLPGGWADVGESPSEAAAREVREESGFEVRICRLLALYDKRRHAHPPQPYYTYKLFFEAEIVGGTEAHSDETDGVGFFSADALPPLSLQRVVPSQLARLFELHDTPDAPPDFD